MNTDAPAGSAMSGDTLTTALADAAAREDRDPVRSMRDLFHIPRINGVEAVYLCGNSLGLQPLSARDAVEEVMDAWQRLGVEGHMHGRHPWMPYHELLTEHSAEVVGAHPVEVVAMNSLTVNLHLMMASFYRPSPSRARIAIEEHAFPSDRHAAGSQLAWHGIDPATGLLELRARDGEDTLRTDDILATLEREGDSIALLLLGGVNYYTGQAFDLETITAHAQRNGIVVGLDLAHAAGNIPLRLHEWGVDFAVWCSYKYLNAGPGATAGCFVHERHGRNPALPRLAGWWGQNKAERFRMGPDFDPIPGAEGWQLSNPAILPMATLRASLEIFHEAGMPRLRERSRRLTGWLVELLKARKGPAWSIITPDAAEDRGAQISIRMHGNGRAVFEALTAHGVICDWREPDVIRIAPAPLYNTYADIARFATLFHAAIEH